MGLNQCFATAPVPFEERVVVVVVVAVPRQAAASLAVHVPAEPESMAVLVPDLAADWHLLLLVGHPDEAV
jgi:hypothetical protein